MIQYFSYFPHFIFRLLYYSMNTVQDLKISQALYFSYSSRIKPVKLGYAGRFCLGKGEICFCIFFRLHIFEHVDISFAIQKILRKMSPTWSGIFSHILPKFRDFGMKLLFLGIFVNISSILPKICPFSTVFGEYFHTDKIFTKIWDVPKFTKNIKTENLGEKI